jgi:Peptidase inhibitor family I36
MLGHPSLTRLGASACVATVIGAAAILAGPVGTAQAATGSCNAGDFCLYYFTSRSGGLYEYSGSDSSLANDHFENADTGQIVNNNTDSAWNRGTGTGLVDVLVYDGTGYSSTARCIKQGRVVNNLGSFNNKISSYRWVTRSVCNTYPQA